MFPKGPPFNFFHFLQPAGDSQSPKGPPFSILSLRYGADFGRSRLVKFSPGISLSLCICSPSSPELVHLGAYLTSRSEVSSTFGVPFTPGNSSSSSSSTSSSVSESVAFLVWTIFSFPFIMSWEYLVPVSLLAVQAP